VMKNILCYGDSLTWGAVPNGNRHAFEARWPTALGATLGNDKVRIIAEGLGGRHTIYDEFSLFADKNGARVLPTLLATHQPLDCVIIMLGTNDMKPHIAGTASAAASGISRLAEIVAQFPYWGDYRVPELVLVAPPHCVATDHAELGPMFAGAPQESKKLAAQYQRVASEFDAMFFDAASVAKASPIDGVHLDAQNTIAIGKGLAPVVGKLLKL
jgi:lysophospholipase L1-like esterase